MANYLEHKVDMVPLKTDTNLANCDVAHTEIYNSGRVLVPTGSAITTLTFYAAAELVGEYLQVFDTAAAVSMTVAGGNTYQLPAAVLGYKYLKVKANAAASGVILALQT